MRIELISRAVPQQRIVVDHLPAMIGRGDAADIRLDDSWVAECQCLLDCRDGNLRIWDIGGKSGTFVDGVRVQRAPLRPGAILTLGTSDYIVAYEPSGGRDYWLPPSSDAALSREAAFASA